MATFTEHYQLHQWEVDDDFLREDFNTDFAKIDGAIKQSATRIKLAEVTTQEDQTEVTIALGELGLTRFKSLEIQGEMKAEYGLRMTVNNIGTGGYQVSTSQSTDGLSAADYCMLCTTGNSTACVFQLQLLRFFGDTAYLSHAVGQGIALYSRGNIPDCTLDQLQTIHLTSFNGRAIRAGSTVTIYGLA